MRKSITVTVKLEVECCDDQGNTGDHTPEPTKEQVIDFIMAAVRYYDGIGCHHDDDAPASVDTLLVHEWEAR